MINQIFVNLHVKDLDKAREFYTKLGFTINEQFSDNTAACVVISEHIFIMLLTHDKFKQFTLKEISDANKTTEVLNALALENKDQVNKMFDAALAAGGSEVDRQKIMASCSPVHLTTLTDISGRSFTWT